MDQIIDLIKEIIRMPGIYIGKKSITLLKAYLDGYVNGANIGNTGIFYPKFQKYIENKFPSTKAYSWANLILINSSSEEEAFDKFCELWNAFVITNLK